MNNGPTGDIATFNQDNHLWSFTYINQPETRTTRNFEQLITERGEELSKPVNSIYLNLYNEIKEKIFISSEGDDIDLVSIQEQKYEKKYNTKETSEKLTKIKEQIGFFYVKKTEHSILLEERRRHFNTFCNTIIETIKHIEDMKKEPSEEESQLICLLRKRIDWYYNELELEKLMEMEYEINSEFFFLKKTIIELSNLNPTICPVCMEHQISWFIDPCGHTICNDCKKKTEKGSNCHYCRTPKMKYNRLYL